MNQSDILILEKVEFAYSSLANVLAKFNLHTFTDVLMYCPDKKTKAERISEYSHSVRLLIASTEGVFAGYFPKEINLIKALSAEISMIQGNFISYVMAEEPEIKSSSNPYVLVVDHCNRLAELIYQVNLFLLRVSAEIHELNSKKI